MTALAAYWALGAGSRPPNPAVQRILRGQQIYGPGGASIWHESELAIGRKLHPLLPEDMHDHGPVTGGGGRWTLTADVRLDARDELATELGIDRSTMVTLSDAAVVMRAVEKWGEEAIPRLIGDFAIILWDARERRLILARDFLGQRPLHYHRGNDFIAVASMPKGLHALPDIPREPDEEAIAQFLALMPEREPTSFFRTIARVAPGEILTLRPDGVRRRIYWAFEPKSLRLKDQEYLDATREALDRAVKDRLRGSESRVASHLSGGLDSGAVAATAARLMAPDGQVLAFTAVPRQGFHAPAFRGRFNDESAHAAAVAGLYPNMVHELVRGAGQSPLAGLDRNFFLYDRPALNLCNNVWMDAILDRAKARKLNVLLTGEMGNMSFSHEGLDRLGKLFAAGRWISLVREGAGLRANGTSLGRIAAQSVGPYLPSSVWMMINRWFGRQFDIREYSAIRATQAARLDESAKRLGVDFSYRPWRDGVAMRKWVLRRIDDGNFRKGVLGGWGIDVRDPTGDRRLVELCLSIPPEQFLRNGETRAVARRAFADRLPQAVVRETRKGYQAADWHEGLRGAWSEASDEATRLSDIPAAASIIDTERLRTLLNEDASRIDWNSMESRNRYRLALLRGLSAGHFVRRALGAN